MDKKVSPRSVSTTPTFVFNPTPVPPKQNAVHKTQTPQASTHKRESTTPTAVSKDNFKTMLHRCAFRLRRRATLIEPDVSTERVRSNEFRVCWRSLSITHCLGDASGAFLFSLSTAGNSGVYLNHTAAAASLRLCDCRFTEPFFRLGRRFK